MAKRRRTVTRSHAPDTSYRPGFSRGAGAPPSRRSMAPPSARKNNQRLWLVGGAVAAVVILAVIVYVYAFNGTGGAGGAGGPTSTVNADAIHPPSATPLASPPATPAGDGTKVTIATALGQIVIDVYNQSAPVASENFVNLANAGFYNGLKFHRIVPDFVIQGGDPAGTGSGGPGYTIPDEPVVGDYTRGIVAMARTSAPNSQGSQFFIVLSDSVASTLPKSGGYVIFGKVSSGMEVVDQIAAGPNSGPPNNTATNPVVMTSVTVQPPSSE